jgi:hypothetical protein
MALLRQSGLQSIYGGFSPHPMLRSVNLESEKELRKSLSPADFLELETKMEQQKLRPEPAPLMVFYPVFLIAGIVLAIGVRPGGLRAKAVAVCSALAVLILVLQTSFGFPLEGAVGQAITQAALEHGGRSDAAAAGVLAAFVFEAHYTAWFWLALISTLFAPALATVEWLVYRRSQQFSG